MSYSSVPVESIHAIGQSVSQGHGAGAAGAHELRVVDNALQGADRPSAQDAAAFARSALAQDSSPAEMQAALPQSADSLSARLTRQAAGLSRQLQSFQQLLAPAEAPGTKTAGPSASNSSGQPLPRAAVDNDAMNGAVAAMEHAYFFAIETSIASRGSTEMTKIFNTLLKGQ